MVKVLLITGLGTALALDRFDALKEDARKHVNKVVFYVFSPALVASKLAETITYQSLLKLWFMPLNILMTFIIGSALGWILVPLTRPPSHLRGLVVGCCAAGNLGNMFLIMIPAVCKNTEARLEHLKSVRDMDWLMFHSLWQSHLSLDLCVQYCAASATETNPESKKLYVGKSSRESSAAELGSCTEPLHPSKEPHDLEPRKVEYQLIGNSSDGKTEITYPCNKLKALLAKVNGKAVFAPSTIGAIVGFLIGLIPYIQKIMIGADAPLHVIQDTASLIGEGAIPTLTLILGGNLLKGLQGSGVQKSVLFGIIVARYIVLPFIGIFIVKGALHFSFISPDPSYQFVLLQFAVPPAMNIGVITQLFGVGETKCSMLMLWAYSLA